MKKKILVVDDSLFIYQEMKYKLHTSEEYEIAYYCPDGEHLLECYEKFQPDLITMDIVMPGMDGIQATKLLLSKYPDARVVMVTSLVFDETMDEAVTVGALGFMAKPFDTNQMIKAFDEAFDKRP